MEFSEAVRRRRMVRAYLDRPVDPATLDRILDTARRGPSAGFAQPQRFLVVTDPAARLRLAQAAGEDEAVARGLRPWLSSAPVHVIPCVTHAAYEARYAEEDKSASVGPGGWEVPFAWVDGGAALMLLLLAAVDEGLSAGFLAVPRNELASAVALPTDWAPLGLVTIGFAEPDGRPGSQGRRRLPLEAVVHHLAPRTSDDD